MSNLDHIPVLIDKVLTNRFVITETAEDVFLDVPIPRKYPAGCVFTVNQFAFHLDDFEESVIATLYCDFHDYPPEYEKVFINEFESMSIQFFIDHCEPIGAENTH